MCVCVVNKTSSSLKIKPNKKPVEITLWFRDWKEYVSASIRNKDWWDDSPLAILHCLLLASCIFLSPYGVVGGFRRFRWEGKLLKTPHNRTPTGCPITSNINLYSLYRHTTWGDAFNRRYARQCDTERMKMLWYCDLKSIALRSHAQVPQACEQSATE